MSTASVVRGWTSDGRQPRQTLVIAEPQPGQVTQAGDATFEANVKSHYIDAESCALEESILLKRQLRNKHGEAFWSVLSENLARIVGSEICFVSKRIFEGKDGSPVPLIGDPGSCLTAVAWYINDGKGVAASASNLQYYAFSCPCAYMKHDRVLLIPSQLESFTPPADNPNAENLPFPLEAYLAVPMFKGDKCVAHFGFSWSVEAAAKRQLGWGFLEMLCHSFEDLVASNLIDDERTPLSKSHSLRMLRASVPGQSLKPYARTLSHELRTPMHGVVGMLDLMYANVQDAVGRLESSSARDVFLNLKDDIEVIQDSSRRAIEAADNIVQAYDLDMGLPPAHRSLSMSNDAASPIVMTDGTNLNTSAKLPAPRGHKRRLSDTDFDLTSPMPKEAATATSVIDRRKGLDSALRESSEICNKDDSGDSEEAVRNVSSKLLSSVGMGLQYSNVRDLVEFVVEESLKVGLRPESALHRNTETGQIIDVVRRLSDGSLESLTVEWGVDWAVPEIVLVEERDLAKLVSCVLQNALKFTEQGRVAIQASMANKLKQLVISVGDTGPGIPASFQSKIFNPFSREDHSTTRLREGLGLGLMVAKGLARKLGGDLMLARSETEGPEHGSEFRLHIPVAPSTSQLALASPFSPKHAAHHSQRGSTPESVSEPVQSPPYASSHSGFGLPSIPTSAPTPTSTSCAQNPSSCASPAPVASVIAADLHTPPLSPRPSSQKPSTSDACTISPPPPSLPASTSNGSPGPAPAVKANDTWQHPARKLSMQRAQSHDSSTHRLATSYPMTFLVVEDNLVNRKLLVNMLAKLGYDKKTQIYEAHDGTDAVNKVRESAAVDGQGQPSARNPIDVILMDLWMPLMDGYTATEQILEMFKKLPRPGSLIAAPTRTKSEPDNLRQASMLSSSYDATTPDPTSAPREAAAGTRQILPPTILAVTADATDHAAEKAARVGMEGFMMKPFKMKDLEKLIKDGWLKRSKMMEEQ